MSAKRKSENPTLEEKICIVLKDLRSFSDFWSKLYEASECSLRRCHVGKFAAKPERFVNKKEPFEKVTFVDLAMTILILSRPCFLLAKEKTTI